VMEVLTDSLHMASVCSHIRFCSRRLCYAALCSAMQRCAVRCSAVQRCAVLCSAVQCDAALCSQGCAVRCSAVQCDAALCSAMQRGAVLHMKYCRGFFMYCFHLTSIVRMLTSFHMSRWSMLRLISAIVTIFPSFGIK
jgi:hypothetical protein